MGALPGDYRILVIDDEIPVLEVMADILVAAGWTVDAFPSPREALARIQGSRYDALVLDLYMHELPGLLVHAKVRLLDRELASRTVFVSGHFSGEELARLVPGSRFLPKPFRAEALTGMVGMALPDAPRRLSGGEPASDRRDGTSGRS